MAPTNPALLPRVKIRYNTSVGNHSMTLHVPSTDDAGAAIARVTPLINKLVGWLHTSQSVYSVEYASAGSSIFNPISSFAGATGTISTTLPTTQKAESLTYVGRTPSGKRARVVFFTDFAGADANYRYTSAESPQVAGDLAMLRASTPPFVAIDGTTPVWKSYADLNHNKHWIRKARG